MNTELLKISRSLGRLSLENYDLKKLGTEFQKKLGAASVGSETLK